MGEVIEIKGGAGEFEGAVIAVVLDRLAREEKATRQTSPGAELSAWVLAGDREDELMPLEIHRPR